MKTRKVFKKSFYALLFVVVAVVGCKTTPPTLGYIKPSKEVLEAYGNRHGFFPYDGAYLDYGKNGGHVLKREVFLYDQNGNPVHMGENVGVDGFGRVLSNAGAFIGAGTLFASPLWGYLGDKKRGKNINNINMSSGDFDISSSAVSH